MKILVYDTKGYDNSAHHIRFKLIEDNKSVEQGTEIKYLAVLVTNYVRLKREVPGQIMKATKIVRLVDLHDLTEQRQTFIYDKSQG